MAKPVKTSASEKPCVSEKTPVGSHSPAMKKHSATRSAYINPRAWVGFVLLFLGVLLALFAFGATPHLPNSKAQEANSSGWFGRFVSAFGVHLESQKFAALPAPRGGGGGAPLSKFPG